MKKSIIKGISMMLILTIILGSIFIPNTGAFAQDLEAPVKSEILKVPPLQEEMLSIPVGEAKYIEDGTGKLIKISDLMSFETEEEADEFSERMKLELNSPIQSNFVNQIAPMVSNGDSLVDSRKLGLNGSAGSINLRVSYRTSGNNFTGRVIYHNEYTTYTGFTLGFDWDQRTSTSYVTSSGKDIYASASGTLNFYILVKGFIRFYSTPLTLSGYAWAIH